MDSGKAPRDGQPQGASGRQRRSSRRLVLTAAITAAAIGVIIYFTNQGGPAAPSTFDGRGRIVVESGWEPFVDGECTPDLNDPVAEALQPGSPIHLNYFGHHGYGGSGQVVGTIHVGRVSGSFCVFRFEVYGIPDEHAEGAYNVEVPGYDAVQVSESALKRGTAELDYR